MIRTILQLIQVLTRKQRREFVILQGFMLLSSAVELVGTVSIMPFIALAADPELMHSNRYFARLHELLGQPPHEQFLVFVGGAFICIILISNLIFLVTQFLMSRYSFRVGGELSARLYGYYLERDVLFHARTNSATLIQRIMRDALILSNSLILPVLRVNSRLFSIVLLSGLLIYVDPLVAISTVAVLGSVYWFIYRFIRRTIQDNGRSISDLGQRRNKLLNESFGGIRDVKLYALEQKYLSTYRADTKQSDRASADNMILGETPYFIVETVVFAGMVLLTLYLYSTLNSLGAALPVLTLYCLAGLKIVPKVQQSYMAITRIRSAQPVFRRLYPDLRNSVESRTELPPMDAAIVPKQHIELKDISFSFAEGQRPLFSNYSLSLDAGKITAVTGSSGSGKTTLLEILMGLVRPQSGYLAVDGRRLDDSELVAWRASIGYVPQEVYLTDSSIAENIAFGVPRERIDMEVVTEAARIACISSVIEQLPEGYWSAIGEQGGLLSGGQRQRIGIARALYRNLSVLILDEATSALDVATQSEVLDNIRAHRPGVTVIMITHRSETLAVADHVLSIRAAERDANESAGS